MCRFAVCLGHTIVSMRGSPAAVRGSVGCFLPASASREANQSKRPAQFRELCVVALPAVSLTKCTAWAREREVIKGQRIRGEEAGVRCLVVPSCVARPSFGASGERLEKRVTSLPPPGSFFFSFFQCHLDQLSRQLAIRPRRVASRYVLSTPAAPTGHRRGTARVKPSRCTSRKAAPCPSPFSPLFFPSPTAVPSDQGTLPFQTFPFSSSLCVARITNIKRLFLRESVTSKKFCCSYMSHADFLSSIPCAFPAHRG